MRCWGQGQIHFETGKEGEKADGQRSGVFYGAGIREAARQNEAEGAVKGSLAFCLFPVVQSE